MENTLPGLTLTHAQRNVEAVAKREQEPVQNLLPNMVEKIVLRNLKNLDPVIHNLVQVRAYLKRFSKF